MSGKSRPGVRRCASCGELTDKWSESLDGLRIINRRFDISVTYDGVTVVSHRFHEVYKNDQLKGLTFQLLPDDEEFFAIQATHVVEFDVERRETSFERQCKKCGLFESIVGATPVFLRSNSTIGTREFVRTDIEFASNDAKHPLMLCGSTAATILKSSSLKGVKLSAI